MEKFDRISILYVLPNLNFGGTETTLVQLVNNLDHTRFDIHLCTLSSPNPLRSELSNEVTYHAIGANKKESVSATLKFMNVVRNVSPDILQSFLRYGNIVAPMMKLYYRDMPVITGIRAVPTDLHWAKDYPERIGLKLSNHVVSNSEAGKDYAIDRGVDSDKISVIPNGRDIEQFSSAEPAEDILSIGPSDGKIVGTVGRLIERKGHQDLLTAWVNIKKEYDDVHLVIVGEGPERENLEERAQKLGIEDSVHLIGTRTDIPAVLAAFDIFVFPSHFEGLPGALIEAMAAGLPIVATDVDGNSELIEHSTSGLLVSVKEPIQLKEETMTLLSNNDRCETYGNVVRQQALSNYSNKKVVTKFDQLYRQLQQNR